MYDYDPVHKVLEFYKVLVQVSFCTNKTELDIYHRKFSISVISRVAKRLKGALSGLRQLLATQSPLKMMKNAFFSP